MSSIKNEKPSQGSSNTMIWFKANSKKAPLLEFAGEYAKAVVGIGSIPVF